MRSLSASQASRCETARGGRCRCRCRGQFHGASRTADPRQLPDTDPHHPGARCPIHRNRTLTIEQLALWNAP